MKRNSLAFRRNAAFFVATALFLCFCSAFPQSGYSQGSGCATYGVTTPRTIPIAGVHAGDTVMVDATLITDDLFDFLEGEPLVLSSPGLGTQKLGLPIGGLVANAHYSFTAVQDDEVISARIDGFDSDETGSVTVCVDALAVTVADIRTDTIKVVLPAGGTGQLVITLIGDSVLTLFDGIRSSGTYTFSFDPQHLPEGQYSQVKAVWTVNGSAKMASRAVAFRVLGSYRHSQYNVPDESTCNPALGQGWITTSACVFKPAVPRLRTLFMMQASLNGSGHSINFGDVRREAECIKAKHNPPPGATDHSFRPGMVTPTCTGETLSDSTVARNPHHRFLDCGDEVLIVGLGGRVGTVKTVTDECPVCGETQLDNFTTKKACSKVGDLGRYVTIRLR
jgi:hypothetical protein